MKSLTLNTLTILSLLAAAFTIVLFGIVFFNPNSAINPYPPATPVKTQTNDFTPAPDSSIQPIAPSVTTSVTSSPTPTSQVSETPTPTTTSVPTPTSTQIIESVTFAVMGDYGLAGDSEAEVANLIKSWEPDFIITTGDNNYPDGSASTIDENIGQYYSDFIYPYYGSYGSIAVENRFFPSLGNHDWRTANAQPYLEYFELPGRERYYSYTNGPVSIFAVDSDVHEPDGTASNSLQAQWLQLSLSASDASWKIVYFHHAPYSSGMHGSTERMRWPFELWGASAVIAGHDHLYERLLIGGIPYFVVGSGGKSLYRFQDPLPESQSRYNDDYGAMLIEASHSSIVYQFFNTSGELIDELVSVSP